MAKDTRSRAFPKLDPKQEEAIKEEARSRCINDLHYLAKEILGYSRVTDHYHKQMARDIDTPKYRFKLLLHPRGHFKSTIGTESRAVQKLIRNPNERILITNAKLDNSRKFLRAIAHHWEFNPKFRWLWREWWLNKYASPYHKAELGAKLDWIMRDTQDEFTLLRPYAGREASITTGAVDSSLVSQHFCLFPDSLVLTSKGYVPVKDVRVGHRVLTKSGCFKSVIAVNKQSATGVAVKIRPAHQSETTTLTGNHRVLACRGDQFLWLEASELKKEDSLVIPRMSGRSGAPSRTNRRVNELYRNPDVWRLLGYWVGDGCRTPDGAQIRIVQGSKEQEHVDDIVSIVKEHLGVPVSVRETKSSTYMICFSDPGFKELTKAFGEYAYSKKLPAWILSNYGNKQAEFLKGYFRADGCHSGNDISFSSTSLDLLAGIQLLLAQHGIPAGIVRGTNGGKATILGVKTEARQDWMLRSTHPMLKVLLGVGPVSYPTKPFRSFFTDKYWVVGIQELERFEVEGQEVYDLQVAGDESFYCPGMIVHNSTIIADDLINRDYVRTAEMVEKSVLYFKDLLDLLDPDGSLELIGTRWSHYDLYEWIIESFGGRASFRVPEGYVKQEILEASREVQEDSKDWMISIQPVRGEDGKPVFAEEFTDKVLNDLLSAKGPYEYGAQYELNPTAKENQKFDENWFNYLDVMPSPEAISQMQICMTVDPAKSLQDHADNSAVIVCGYDEHNRMYLLDGLDEKLAPDELTNVVFELARLWYERGRMFLPVGFEAIGFQETYVHALERKMMEEGFFFGIEAITHRKQSKEERILRLVPRLRYGFYIPRRFMKTPHSGRGSEYDLTQRIKYQLVKFPFAGMDDLADALADQLDIVKSGRLPTEKVVSLDERKPEFTHWSVKQDKRKTKYRRSDVSDAVR